MSMQTGQHRNFIHWVASTMLTLMYNILFDYNKHTNVTSLEDKTISLKLSTNLEYIIQFDSSHTEISLNLDCTLLVFLRAHSPHGLAVRCQSCVQEAPGRPSYHWLSISVATRPDAWRHRSVVGLVDLVSVYHNWVWQHALSAVLCSHT